MSPVAAPTLRSSSTLNPTVPWPALFAAEAALQRGRMAEAKRLLDAALAESRGAAWIRLSRYRLRRLARLPGAMRDLDTAFRADPRCAWIFGLEDIPKDLGPQAAALIRALAEFGSDPRCAPVYAYRGQARLFRGESAAGLEDLEKAAALEPSGWIMAWLGEAYRRGGDNVRAETALSEALRLDARYANAYAWRGTVRLALEKWDEARADLDRALRLCPTARAWMDRARLHRAAGRMAESLDDLENAVGMNPELTWGGADPESLRRSLVEIEAAERSHPREARLGAWRGDTLLRLHEAAQAHEALSRAVRALPKFALAFVWRAQAGLESGARAEAIRRDLDRGLALDPNNARAHWVQACLLTREGESSKALESLDAAIRGWRYGARLFHARSQLLLSLGRRSAARRDLERCLKICPTFPITPETATTPAWSSAAWP